MRERRTGRRVDLALVVVLAGVSAALHIGKLPPALPVLREALQISLVQAGFLLSLVQLAGMGLGLAVGLAGESLGLKRCMAAGLVLLGVASIAGGFAQDAAGLLVLRALEGFGFLLAVTPGPSLIRRVAEPGELDAKLGLWGAYMPLG
ncbi:MAG TPA: MFS transporter, partial [Pseudorhodoferax sp.]|nr:MFS transporter [Pseudorhodoferax sp.]